MKKGSIITILVYNEIVQFEYEPVGHLYHKVLKKEDRCKSCVSRHCKQEGNYMSFDTHYRKNGKG